MDALKVLLSAELPTVDDISVWSGLVLHMMKETTQPNGSPPILGTQVDLCGLKKVYTVFNHNKCLGYLLVFTEKFS